jgi:quercetin dioxygenase-like cupin family protein
MPLYKTNINDTIGAAVTEEGAIGVEIKWLINTEHGAPTFLMRHFTVDADGFTPFHSHDWEHEVYVLEGSGMVRYEDREERIGPGDAILISPNRRHQFRASSSFSALFRSEMGEEDPAREVTSNGQTIFVSLRFVYNWYTVWQENDP